MDPAAWAAFGGLAFTVVSSIAIGSFVAGQHSQKIVRAQEDIDKLREKTDSHAATLASIEGVKQLLEEVRHDVKNLLTGRVQPPGRRGPES